MLAQDPLTGYFHEVPEALYDYGYAEYPEVAEAPVAYDGLGYPVGLPFLAPIMGALAPMAARAVGGLIPQAGRLIGGLLPQAGGLLRRLFPGGGRAPAPGLPGLPRLPMPGLPGMPGMPGLPMPAPFRPRPFFRAPPPVGSSKPSLASTMSPSSPIRASAAHARPPCRSSSAWTSGMAWCVMRSGGPVPAEPACSPPSTTAASV